VLLLDFMYICDNHDYDMSLSLVTSGSGSCRNHKAWDHKVSAERNNSFLKLLDTSFAYIPDAKHYLLVKIPFNAPRAQHSVSDAECWAHIARVAENCAGGKHPRHN
jgi:hypothetical protein